MIDIVSQMGYNMNMKTSKKQKRVPRCVYLPEEIDRVIRRIATQEKRSVTRTMEILLGSALRNNGLEPEKEATA